MPRLLLKLGCTFLFGFIFTLAFLQSQDTSSTTSSFSQKDTSAALFNAPEQWIQQPVSEAVSKD